MLPRSGPCDFFLFPKIKFVLKEINFFGIDSIKMAATTELKKFSENAFQECIEFEKRQMHKCSKVEGDYFEGIRLRYIRIFFNSFYNICLITFSTHLVLRKNTFSILLADTFT